MSMLKMSWPAYNVPNAAEPIRRKYILRSSLSNIAAGNNVTFSINDQLPQNTNVTLSATAAMGGAVASSSATEQTILVLEMRLYNAITSQNVIGANSDGVTLTGEATTTAPFVTLGWFTTRTAGGSALSTGLQFRPAPPVVGKMMYNNPWRIRIFNLVTGTDVSTAAEFFSGYAVCLDVRGGQALRFVN